MLCQNHRARRNPVTIKEIIKILRTMTFRTGGDKYKYGNNDPSLCCGARYNPKHIT